MCLSSMRLFLHRASSGDDPSLCHVPFVVHARSRTRSLLDAAQKQEGDFCLARRVRVRKQNCVTGLQMVANRCVPETVGKESF